MANETKNSAAAPASLSELKDYLAGLTTKEIDAAWESACKATCDEYKEKYGSFNQAANALAIAKAIRKVLPMFGTAKQGGTIPPEVWKQILGLLYRGGNASASRQAISGEKKTGGGLAEKYANADVG